MIAAVTRPTKSKREGSRIFLNLVSFLFVSSVIKWALRSRKRGSRPLSMPTWIMRARAVSPKDLSMLWEKSPPRSISFFIFSNSSFTAPLSVMSAISARASDKVFPLFKSADRASVTRMRYSLRIKGKRKRNASVLLFPRSLRNQTTPPTAPKRSSTSDCTQEKFNKKINPFFL